MIGKYTYLRNPSNFLDLLIVIFSLLGVETFSFQQNKNFSKLKVFRLLRVLRPFKLITKSRGLRLAIDSLLKSIPTMINLFIVIMILYLLFGVFLVSYLKGT